MFSLFSHYFEGNENIPVHSTDGCAMLAEQIISILLEVDEKMVATEQPLHCTSTSSFVVNCDKLAHPSDIKMDDLGSWTYTGVDRLYFNIVFSEKKVRSITKLGCRPAVMRKSVYCLTRSYWKHKHYMSFSRQLHQITGMFENYYHQHYVHVCFL